jgi:hypothetical protein
VPKMSSQCCHLLKLNISVTETIVTIVESIVISGWAALSSGPSENLLLVPQF